MPLIALVRAVLTLLSLALLGLAAYLLWSWWNGEWVRDADDTLYRVREDWRLWTGLGLFAWSFLGRLVLTPLLARADDGAPSTARRGDGEMIQGSSGSQLYVETHGDATAPTIILTHGWGLDSTIWSYAKRDLCAYRLVLWDLPGLGRSRLARGAPVSLTGFASDLATVIAYSGAPSVILVGHSIGGMTIQTLARDYPEVFRRSVAGAVLLNTTYTNPLRTMILSGLAQALRRPLIEPLMRVAIWLQPLAWLSAWQSYFSGTAHLANRLGFGRYVSRSQLEHTTLLATRNPPAAQAKGNLAMFRWDAKDALTGCNRPVLVVGGDMDIVTKLGASETIARSIPTAQLQVVDGVNHMGFLERAEVYNRALVDFAQALAVGAASEPAFVAPSADLTKVAEHQA